MKLRILLVLSVFMTLILSGSAIARKPAVESVVGVEPESYKTTSLGTEVQFNFGNFIHVEAPKAKTQNNQQTTNQTPAWLATSTLIAFITLPFLMWFAISRSTRSIEAPEQEVAQEEATPDNVTNLSDFKPQTTGSDNKKDGGKKAA